MSSLLSAPCERRCVEFGMFIQFLSSYSTLSGFHTEGGVPWDIPPRSSFPPPRISYHNVIMNQIENCTSINASGVVATTSCNYPKCIRINLRECKDQKFSGGACPQTPLVCRASTKHGFPPPKLKILYETLPVVHCTILSD